MCRDPLPKPLEWDAVKTCFHPHPIGNEQPAGSSQPTTPQQPAASVTTLPNCLMAALLLLHGSHHQRPAPPTAQVHKITQCVQEAAPTAAHAALPPHCLRHVHSYRHYCACLLLLDTYTVMQAT